MKTVLTLFFSLCVCIVFAQDTDTTITRADYRVIKTGDQAVTYHFITDTIDASTNDDTTRIILPHEFVTAMAGVIYVTVDTILAEDILVGSWDVVQSQCLDTCPTDITSGTLPVAVGIANADDGVLAISDIRAWVDLISTEGVGIISLWITLKP